MKSAAFCATVVALAAVAAALPRADRTSVVEGTGGKRCVALGGRRISNNNTGHLKRGEKAPGGSASSAGNMSSQITAGGGSVSGSTTTGSGPAVSTHAGPGSGSTSISTSSSNGRTVVTSSDGSCTVYIEDKK
jgi:hypothetical protein